MKILFTIISLIILNVSIVISQHSYDSTKISPNVQNIVNKLSKHKRVEGVFIGMVGTPSKIYQTGKKLRLRATKEELVELTFHPNPIVRAYSFWGLAEKNETGLLNILLDHLNDTVNISTMFADAVDEMRLGDFLIELVVPKYVFTADYLYPNKSILTENEKNILDSTLIFTDNNLEYTHNALLRTKPELSYYERIKELAKRKNIYAMVALAKYRNSENTDLIISSFYLPKNRNSYFESYYYTFWAFSEFPNESFEVFTKSVFDTIVKTATDERDLKTLYKAIASYKKPDFLKYLKSSNADLDYYSFIAMTEFSDPLYDSLLFRIWEERKIITFEALNYLIKINRAKTIELMIKSIEQENKYLNIPVISIWSKQIYKKALDFMFDTLLVTDKVSAMNIINSKLLKADFWELEFYCSKAKDIDDSSLIKTILMRLKTDTENTFNNDNYWALMKVFVSKNSKELDKKTVQAILKNEYAVKKHKYDEKELFDDIDLIRRSLNRVKSFDEEQLDKYR
ncbi:MAG: hypothetical protein ABI543_15220 [Ignavibacteria bacterium]